MEAVKLAKAAEEKNEKVKKMKIAAQKAKEVAKKAEEDAKKLEELLKEYA